MMKMPILIAAVLVPASAAASVITLGTGLAQSCYFAADARDTHRQSFDACNRALTEEALTSEDRVATHVNRGILHLIRGDVRQAHADFDSALRLDPTEPEAWLNKAIAHARFGRTADAMPLVQKALELNTRRPALAYFVRAMAHEDNGNIAGAYQDLRRAQQLEPKWREPAIELRRFKVKS